MAAAPRCASAATGGATPSAATSRSTRSTRRRTARSSTWSAGLPTSTAARSASSATPRCASARISCASCASSASSPGTAPAGPTPTALKACARLKDGLDQLSAERVWAELKKLLSAPDPSRALLWMRQAGVLTRILPESEKWGIDLIHPLVKAEADLGWPADPLLRLEALVPPDAERIKALAERLKLSAAEAARLKAWARSPAIAPTTTESALARAALCRRQAGGARPVAAGAGQRARQGRRRRQGDDRGRRLFAPHPLCREMGEAGISGEGRRSRRPRVSARARSSVRR